MSFFRVLLGWAFDPRFIVYGLVIVITLWAVNGFSLSVSTMSEKELIMVFGFLTLIYVMHSRDLVLGELDEIKKRLPPEEPAEQDAPEEEQDAAKEE